MKDEHSTESGNPYLGEGQNQNYGSFRKKNPGKTGILPVHIINNFPLVSESIAFPVLSITVGKS